MNAIQELQSEILNSSASLSNILRKAKVVAYGLKNDDLKQWVENELNGYAGDEDSVPEYRKLNVKNYGNFSGSFGRALNKYPIPTSVLNAKVDNLINHLTIREGISAIETLLNSDTSEFQVPWPGEVISLVSSKMYQGYNLVYAWQEIGRAQLAQILDTIRNRLLSLVLELEERYPDISTSDEAIANVPREQATSMVQMNIFGSHNVVASGTNIAQIVEQPIVENDIEALLSFIGELGLSEQETNELRSAIEEDTAAKSQEKPGPKVQNWLIRITKKAAQGMLAIAPTAIMKALLAYYGIRDS